MSEPTIMEMEAEIAPICPTFGERSQILHDKQADMRRRMRIASRCSYSVTPKAKPLPKNEDKESELISYLLDSKVNLDHATQSFREAYAIAACRRAGWNQCKAARLIGTHRNTIARLIDGQMRKAGMKDRRR